jgi:hypothetical protein
MRWMTSMLLAVVVATVGGMSARGAAPDVLDAPVRVSWVDAKLTDALADLASQTGVGFILDPEMSSAARSATISYASNQTSFKVALGRALKAAGLRYAIIGGAIWISTPERVAQRIVYKGQENLEEAEPMSRGEALDTLSPDDDDVPSLGDLSRPQKPWKRAKAPSVNPVTGLTDFPAPPIWVESDDADNPRFKYASTPSFLKPEYRTEGASDSTDALAIIITVVKTHPEWSREEILAVMEKYLSAAQQ